MHPLSPDLLRRFDVPGPRYTSYPTADRFVEAFTAADYVQALSGRNARPAPALPLSIYVHIPFCESLCYYCGCNKIITKHHDRAARYLKYLAREIDLHTPHMGPDQNVSQLHLGGGTPTFLADAELAALMALLRRSFNLLPGGEYSIEIDPRTVDGDRLANIAALGFNRVSFGVQDFDPQVQQAVNRVQPAEQVFALVADARRIGFDSVNVDLIYGLPKQTPETFARTLEQVCELRPDRIALYRYAHLPERFKAQRRIDAVDLPAPPSKLAMLSQSLDAFATAGYDYIGMDHFALPAMRSPLPKGRAACIATSRATARSRIAISSAWACPRSAVWARPTARMPRRWKNTATCSTRDGFPSRAGWRCAGTTSCGAP